MECLSRMVSEAQLKELERQFGDAVRKVLLQPTGRENPGERIYKEVAAPHILTFKFNSGKVVSVTRSMAKY